jgi:hypothetical protein
MANKLTDRDSIVQLQQDFLVHVVDTNDTTQSPDGSSFKATVGQFVELSKDYIISATLSGDDLVFTGTGSAFNGTIDLSSLGSGSIFEKGGGTFSIQPILGNNSALCDLSTVSGGYGNTSSACGSTIGGGAYNSSYGCFSTISGGAYNTLTEKFNFVGGGCGNYNSVSSNYSSVVGGKCNHINNAYTFIGGGQNNKTCGLSSVVTGGCSNTSYCSFSSVGGGRNNITSGNYSTVGGGFCNTASGQHSGILGGSNNNTNSLNCAMIVGSDITAVAACTLHINCLAIMNIPTSPAGLTAGQIWRDGIDLKIVI